jgi:DNA-binding NtrC family response regulator
VKISLGTPLSEAEREIIQANLSYFRGNKSKTAEVLGIGRKTLHRKLKEYGIEETEEEEKEGVE